MPAIDGLRSPFDLTLGGLHHLGRMIDKIRLHLAGRLPEDFQRNYGLSVGLDGQFCGFLGVKFVDVEARVRDGGTDAEIAEWILAHGLRPNRGQTLIWNEYSRKVGWNDRVSNYLQKQIVDAGVAGTGIRTSFEMIEHFEGRRPVPDRASAGGS